MTIEEDREILGSAIVIPRTKGEDLVEAVKELQSVEDISDLKQHQQQLAKTCIRSEIKISTSGNHSMARPRVRSHMPLSSRVAQI